MNDAFDTMTREQLLAVVKAPPNTENITIRDTINFYLVHMRDRVAKGEIHADHLENVARDIERFALAHGGSLVKDCTQHTLTTFIRSRPAWRSAHAQKAVSGHIGTCMRWAKEQGLIAENPFRRVNPRVAIRTRRLVSPAEYVALMRHASRA
jgi:hypothetical protein